MASMAIIENPDKIECTLSFTMTLAKWKEIRETLRIEKDGFAELEIINQITDLVSQLEKTFYSKHYK